MSKDDCASDRICFNVVLREPGLVGPHRRVVHLLPQQVQQVGIAILRLLNANHHGIISKLSFITLYAHYNVGFSL